MCWRGWSLLEGGVACRRGAWLTFLASFWPSSSFLPFSSSSSSGAALGAFSPPGSSLSAWGGGGSQRGEETPKETPTMREETPKNPIGILWGQGTPCGPPS